MFPRPHPHCAHHVALVISRARPESVSPHGVHAGTTMGPYGMWFGMRRVFVCCAASLPVLQACDFGRRSMADGRRGLRSLCSLCTLTLGHNSVQGHGGGRSPCSRGARMWDLTDLGRGG